MILHCDDGIRHVEAVLEEPTVTVSAITSPARAGAKVYYQSGPRLVPVRAHGRHAGRRGHWQPSGGQCPRLPLKNETGTNTYY